MEEESDRQTDKQTDRQTDRQTESTKHGNISNDFSLYRLCVFVCNVKQRRRTSLLSGRQVMAHSPTLAPSAIHSTITASVERESRAVAIFVMRMARASTLPTLLLVVAAPPPVREADPRPEPAATPAPPAALALENADADADEAKDPKGNPPPQADDDDDQTGRSSFMEPAERIRSMRSREEMLMILSVGSPLGLEEEAERISLMPHRGTGRERENGKETWTER